VSDGPDGTVPTAPSARVRAGRGRAAAVLVLAAALTGACALPTWLHATERTVLGVDTPIDVSGGRAAPSLVAAALVLLAAVGAVALVGRVGRWLVVTVVALAGLLVVAGALGVLRDPQAAARSSVVDALGVDRAVADLTVTSWPWVALVVGVLDVAAAVWLARASRSWAVARRYDDPAAGSHGARDAARAERPGSFDERDQWDALSRGDDPSAPSAP